MNRSTATPRTSGASRLVACRAPTLPFAPLNVRLAVPQPARRTPCHRLRRRRPGNLKRDAKMAGRRRSSGRFPWPPSRSCMRCNDKSGVTVTYGKGWPAASAAKVARRPAGRPDPYLLSRKRTRHIDRHSCFRFRFQRSVHETAPRTRYPINVLTEMRRGHLRDGSRTTIFDDSFESTVTPTSVRPSIEPSDVDESGVHTELSSCGTSLHQPEKPTYDVG
jgi:hypothetical protein